MTKSYEYKWQSNIVEDLIKFIHHPKFKSHKVSSLMRILFTLGLHSHSTALLSIMLIHLKYLIMLNYFKYGAFQYNVAGTATSRGCSASEWWLDQIFAMMRAGWGRGPGAVCPFYNYNSQPGPGRAVWRVKVPATTLGWDQQRAVATLAFILCVYESMNLK